MSARNQTKRKRSAERWNRKTLAAKRISYQGLIVTKKDVIGQRYLAVHNLPFSRTVAAVPIEAASAATQEAGGN